MIEFGKKDIKQIFIDKAQECFSRYGFKKTTMDEIAHAAGKAKSSLYYYFKNKEEIIESITRNEAIALNEEINAAVNKESDPQKKLFTYIITRMTAVVKTANLYNLLKSDYIEHYASLEKLRMNYDKEEKKMLKEIFQYGIDQGVFVIKDPDALISTFIIGLKGFELELMDEKDLVKLEKDIRNMTDIILYGLLKR